jgi:RNA polymerase sigma-70 factor (ECF subfamily)
MGHREVAMKTAMATVPLAKMNETDAATFVRKHQAGVWRYLRVLGSQAAEADDLTQEVFLVLLRRMDRGRFDVVGDESTFGFLRRTARHLFLQRRRADSRSRLRLRADLVEEIWANRSVSPDAWVIALQDCIATLSGRPRDAVRLCYQEGMSRRDAARELGLKETGVKTLLQRTRAALRECVERSVK